MNDPGLPKMLVDSANVAGAGIGLVAILVALRTNWTARRTIANERHRQFELDVLREIADIAISTREPSNDIVRQRRLGAKLRLVCKDADFCLTRAALHERAAPSDVKRFDNLLRQAMVERYEHNRAAYESERQGQFDGSSILGGHRRVPR
jgi:hypothetical protein